MIVELMNVCGQVML